MDIRHIQEDSGKDLLDNIRALPSICYCSINGCIGQQLRTIQDVINDYMDV